MSPAVSRPTVRRAREPQGPGDDVAIRELFRKTLALAAHLNVAQPGRDGRAALALRDHVDRICRSSGLSAWVGEVNAPVGSRRHALARVVGEIVASTPNHTLTWLTGARVERLTVVRRLSRDDLQSDVGSRPPRGCPPDNSTIEAAVL